MTDIRTSELGAIPYGDNAGRPSNPEIGKLYSNGESQRLELYTESGWNNIVQEVPGVSGISGTYNDSESSGTITVAGTNFVSGALVFATGTNGVEVNATSVTFNSIVQLTAVFSGLSAAYEPYDIKVVNPSNLFGILPDALFINNTPSWSTSAGSIGSFTTGAPVSASVLATDQEETSVAYSSSTLPSWLSLNTSTGSLTGTAPVVTQPTTYSFSIIASDGVNTSSRSFSILINDQDPVWVTSSPLPSFTKNVSYSTQLSATDDSSGSLTYSLYSGTLPTGIALSSSGLISGTPSSAISASIVIRVSDQYSHYTDKTFILPNTGPVWSTASGNLPSVQQSGSYSYQLSAIDDSGVDPTYTISSGSLPTGLTLSSSGLISGTASGTTSTFTVAATDQNSVSSTREFNIPILPANTWIDLFSTTTPTQVNEGYYGYHDGFVYLGGGQTSGTATYPTTFYKVNVTTGVSTTLASGPQRDEVGSVILNGKLYVFGGAIQNGAGGQTNTLHIYNISANSWTEGAQFSELYYNSHVGTDGTNIYLTPASTTGNYTMFRYNVASNTYTQLASTGNTSDSLGSQTPKMGYKASTNQFFTVGYSSSNAQQRFYRYNVSANNWTILGTTIPRSYGDQIWGGADNYAYGFEYIPSKDAVYIFGWSAGATISTGITRPAGTGDKVIKYDVASNTTSLVGNDLALTGGASWTNNNALYFLGGFKRNTSNQVVSTTEMKVFYPG